MIHKIERLVSIGKYRNYQAAGQVNFHKLTLIYGDNGGGKTTLTSVLRSLSLNDPLLITNRKSTNAGNPQAAQIVYRNGGDIHHTFHHANGWTNPLSDVEIFDIHFVNENIYSGYTINEDHKRQLHQFVVGAQGVAIQQSIERNKTKRLDLKARITTLTNELVLEVGNGLTKNDLQAFYDTPPTEANDVDAKTAAAEQTLANANAQGIIQGLQLLTSLQQMHTGINFADLNRDLQVNIQGIQEKALQSLFEQHAQELEANSLSSAEGWLKSGYQYLQTKLRGHDTANCPFCTQAIRSSSDLIRAYALKFNEEFNRHTAAIQYHLQTIRAFNIDASLQAFTASISANTERTSHWARHLPATVTSPITTVIPNEQEFREQYQSLIELLERKLQNPSAAVELTSVTAFQNTGTEINRNIRNYNQEVATYNTAIGTFRAGIKTVAQAQSELLILKRIKKRFETEISSKCENITRETRNLTTLETEYSTLTAQQQADVVTFFANYKDRINHYLTDVFKTPFKIEDVKHIAPQGRSVYSKLGYKLTIDGHDISFNEGEAMSTKECLSEGDKSTIALAFFLSKLDLDPNKANKILVFDDPLSSLDSKRRTYTVAIIRRLNTEMKQVIVLSHNEYFLHEISRNINAQHIRTLSIVENFVTKESSLEPCDLDELAKSDYFRQIEALEDFRTNPDMLKKDSVLGWLRTVLEAHIRFKFYREIRTMGGQKVFGSLIAHLDASGAVFNDNAHRTDIITKLHMINGVSWMPHHGTPMPDYNSLGYNPNSITAAELDGLIVDTLDLINSRL